MKQCRRAGCPFGVAKGAIDLAQLVKQPFKYVG